MEILALGLCWRPRETPVLMGPNISPGEEEELESRHLGESDGKMSSPPGLRPWISEDEGPKRGPEGVACLQRSKGVILRPTGLLDGEPSWQPKLPWAPLALGTTKPKCKGIYFLRKTHTYTF